MRSMTPAEIVEALGGTAEVADQLGVSLSVVSNMKQRGIPRSRLLELHLLAERKGAVAVTAEVLQRAVRQRVAA
jgi:hypothetical protein